MSKNKHGLSRRISDNIKRQVRQRCGFGCIVCGCAIIQYHHFAPEFVDATEHNPDGITLLCGKCHDKARGHYTPHRIATLNANPRCLQQGYVQDDFLFLANDEIHFQIGSATFKNHSVVVYDDIPLIAFAPGISANEPLRLFARMETDDSEHLMEIDDNEWRVGSDHFDVETVSNMLIVRRKLGDILLRMIVEDGDIRFDRLKMGFRGYKIGVTDGRFDVSDPFGSRMLLTCPSIKSTLRLSSSGGICV